MSGDWARYLARNVGSDARLPRRAGIDGDEVVGEEDIAELLTCPEVASMALGMSEAEIEAAVPEKDACYETRATLVEEATENWRVNWRAAERAVEGLLAVVRAFLHFCTDASARAHLTRAAGILDELRSVASDGRQAGPSDEDIKAMLRGI